jgi:hypothetical protein
MSAGIFGLRANESIGGTGYLEGIILPYVVAIAFKLSRSAVSSIRP